MKSEFAIRDAGDSALLLELEAVIDPEVNARVIAIAKTIAEARLAGVRDVIPTYRSVAVHFEPLVTDIEGLRSSIRSAVSAPPVAQRGRLIEVPAAYGNDYGPDLQDVAALAKLSPDEVIARHTRTDYRVFLLGFLPGFAYMGTVDEAIAAPRRAAPRTRVPAGSVGIAGRQTGVYPSQSPGGWQLIGRTALRVFDPSREQPSLFEPGDRVRFVRVEAIADPGSGTRSEARIPNPQSRSIAVLKPGLFTTIQDTGRWRYQDRGVPVAGPMDLSAYRLANALVENAGDAAVLEATVLGPELRFEQPSVFAITGADLSPALDGAAIATNASHTCSRGSILRFGERRSGTRAYIAIDGGIDVPRILGSRATHVVSGLGGLEGRALKAGDRLPVGLAAGSKSRSVRLVPRASGGARLRVMRGPQDDQFDEAAFDLLYRTRFVISPQSDRMGYRLVGSERTRPTLPGKPALTGRPGPFGPGVMISDATFMGALQVPPSGDPILLMADRQTTGGYPQIVTVITADLPLAGQLAPGDWIEFAPCTRAEAIAALIEQEERMRAL